jgi:hypothetical protein
LFFYQWGINKAGLFSNSTLKVPLSTSVLANLNSHCNIVTTSPVQVLLAMESRAAEPAMWAHVDKLDFDSQTPVFDYVLTHDRSLLQRAAPLNYPYL